MGLAGTGEYKEALSKIRGKKKNTQGCLLVSTNALWHDHVCAYTHTHTLTRSHTHRQRRRMREIGLLIILERSIDNLSHSPKLFYILTQIISKSHQTLIMLQQMASYLAVQIWFVGIKKISHICLEVVWLDLEGIISSWGVSTIKIPFMYVLNTQNNY